MFYSTSSEVFPKLTLVVQCLFSKCSAVRTIYFRMLKLILVFRAMMKCLQLTRGPAEHTAYSTLQETQKLLMGVFM